MKSPSYQRRKKKERVYVMWIRSSHLQRPCLFLFLILSCLFFTLCVCGGLTRFLRAKCMQPVGGRRSKARLAPLHSSLLPHPTFPSSSLPVGPSRSISSTHKTSHMAISKLIILFFLAMDFSLPERSTRHRQPPSVPSRSLFANYITPSSNSIVILNHLNPNPHPHPHTT